MKVTYHIPTEQYGFVEIEREWGGPHEGVSSYEDVKDSLMLNKAPTDGLDAKEWCRALDGYLELGTMPSNVYESMNEGQRKVIQEIKKAFKRMNPSTEPRVRE